MRAMTPRFRRPPAMPRHHTGYRPSKLEDLARFKHVRHLLGAAPTYPPASSTSQHAPPVLDQGPTSSCGGHGSCVGVATALAAKGFPLPFVPSPKGIYDDAREVGRATLPDGSLAPLTDDGIDPATLLQSLALNGVRPIQAPTSDGRYSDCEPSTINVPETVAEDEIAQQDLLVGEYMIDPRDAAFPGLLAACIAKGVPVGMGIPATGAFESWGDSYTPGKAPLAGPGDFNAADHWIVCLDYRTETDGSLSFLIRNSWSEAWGCPDQKSKGGCIWVSAAWLQTACAEAIAFDVTIKVPAVTP